MLLYTILQDVEHFRSQLLGRETNKMSCPEHCCRCKIYIQVKTVTQKAGSQFQHHAEFQILVSAFSGIPAETGYIANAALILLFHCLNSSFYVPSRKE